MKLITIRLALFIAVAGVLQALPISLDPFLRLLIAMLVSMVLSVFVLRGARREIGERIAARAERSVARHNDPATDQPPVR